MPVAEGTLRLLVQEILVSNEFYVLQNAAESG